MAQALQVLIGNDLDRHLSKLSSVGADMEQLFRWGNYDRTGTANVEWNKELGFLTLTPSRTYTDQGTDAWTGSAAAGAEVPTLSDIREMFSYRKVAVRMDAVEEGFATFTPTLGENQPFAVWFSQYTSTLYTGPDAHNFTIYWGKNSMGESAPTNLPSDQAKWKLEIVPNFRRSILYFHNDVEQVNGLGIGWIEVCRGSISPEKSSQLLDVRGVMIEPKPPNQLLITGLGGLTGSLVANTATIEEAEQAQDNGVEFQWWPAGQVSVSTASPARAFVTTIQYPSAGTVLSNVVRPPVPFYSFDDLTTNWNRNGILVDESGNPLGKLIPQTQPTGTSVTVECWHETENRAVASGDFSPDPLQAFRFKLTLTSNTERTKTPYVRNANIGNVGESTIVGPSWIDATGQVLGGSVRRDAGQLQRSGTLVLDNTSGVFSHVFENDNIPVEIKLGDYYIFKGYATLPDETYLGPGEPTTDQIPVGETPDDDVNMVRRLSLDLADGWRRLSHTFLAGMTMEDACDFYFHNQAIFWLLKNRMGMDTDDILSPKTLDYPNIVVDETDGTPNTYDDDFTWGGSVGRSVLLVGAYNSEYPTWIPEVGESVSSFIQRIWEGTDGGYEWEFFFTEEGKVYLWPQYNRRNVAAFDGRGQSKAKFYPLTSDVDANDRWPILGEPTRKMDWENYVNSFTVLGEWRDVASMYDIAPPVIDGLPMQFMPIAATWEWPESWDEALHNQAILDGGYPYFIGEKRPMVVVNPSLVTYAEIAYAVRRLAIKYGRPINTWAFKSYYIPRLRPGDWCRIMWPGVEDGVVVRLRSMNIDLSQCIFGENPQAAEMTNDWIVDYEFETVEDFELW